MVTNHQEEELADTTNKNLQPQIRNIRKIWNGLSNNYAQNV